MDTIPHTSFNKKAKIVNYHISPQWTATPQTQYENMEKRKAYFFATSNLSFAQEGHSGPCY
jgi:hypothetical protein